MIHTEQLRQLHKDFGEGDEQVQLAILDKAATTHFPGNGEVCHAHNLIRNWILIDAIEGEREEVAKRALEIVLELGQERKIPSNGTRFVALAIQLGADPTKIYVLQHLLEWREKYGLTLDIEVFFSHLLHPYDYKKLSPEVIEAIESVRQEVERRRQEPLATAATPSSRL